MFYPLTYNEVLSVEALQELLNFIEEKALTHNKYKLFRNMQQQQ